MALIETLKKLFLHEPRPFVQKRDLNWKAIYVSAGVGISSAVLAILLLPGPGTQDETFAARTETSLEERTPTTSTIGDQWSEVSEDRSYIRPARALDSILPSTSTSHEGRSADRSSQMIITRGGLDLRNQVPPGVRIRAKLLEKVVLTSQPLPVLGVIVHDLNHEGHLALPRSSKLFGEASFDGSSQRASVKWKAVQMPDGRERPFTGESIGDDQLPGVAGSVHSDGTKNLVGKLVGRAVGAYAEGSIQSGPFGAQPGGHSNGMKNAVSEVARSQVEDWSEDLKKERSWIELTPSTEFQVILTQPFNFRDPGAIIGQ